ncbi:hypothetical protein ACVOMT_22495 [Sphingomonas panni]
MIRKGWLTHREGGLRAAPDGRDQARVSLHGITTFMNMGTKLLDVAMMMKVLNHREARGRSAVRGGPRSDR